MPISPYVKRLRDKIGHDVLLLPGVLFGDFLQLLMLKRKLLRHGETIPSAENRRVG